MQRWLCVWVMREIDLIMMVLNGRVVIFFVFPYCVVLYREGEAHRISCHSTSLFGDVYFLCRGINLRSGRMWRKRGIRSTGPPIEQRGSEVLVAM